VGVVAAGLPVNVAVGFPLVQPLVGPVGKNGVTTTVVVGGVMPVTTIVEELVEPAPLLEPYSPGPVKLTSPFWGHGDFASGPSNGHPPWSLNSRNANVAFLSVIKFDGSNVDVNRKLSTVVVW